MISKDTKKLLTITIDAEADNIPDPRVNSISNVKGIDYLQELCDKFDTSPTYLITYEMATQDEAIKVLKNYSDKGKCEIGHHLHIWSTPPFENANRNGVDEKWIGGIQSEIDDESFYAKMQALHNAIQENYQITPRSHRAGRWDIDRRTLIWLAENNYLVDTSICSYVSWKNVAGIRGIIELDTSFIGNKPYYPDLDDISRIARDEDDRIDILEVPVTGIEGDLYCRVKRKIKKIIRNTNNDRNQTRTFRKLQIDGIEQKIAKPTIDRHNSKNKSFSKSVNNALRMIGYNRLTTMSFRPSSGITMKVFEKAVRQIFEKEIPVYNFMFHSTELTIGTSHFTSDKDKLGLVIKKIIFVMKTAKEYGIACVNLSRVPELLNNQVTKYFD